MKYKFDAFNAEIESPEILGLTWIDSYGATSMVVSATLGNQGGKYGVELGVFDYSQARTYDDIDVMNWAILKIEQFKAEEKNKI